MRTVRLGKFGGIFFGDAALAVLDQFGDSLAEVCFQHAFRIIQLVQIHATQNTRIDGHGSHDVLDEQVGLVAVFPLASIRRIVLAVILATADIIIILNGELGFLMAQFLQCITTVDVHRRIVAELGVDDQAIRFFSSLETLHVDDGLGGKTTVVHHIAGSVIGISQSLQLNLFVRVGSRKPDVAGISICVRKVIGTGSQ